MICSNYTAIFFLFFISKFFYDTNEYIFNMKKSIPRNHPRYESLMTREKISEGLQRGFVHETGLIAHGRGEAFDYLLGERTHDFSRKAMKAAAEMLLDAKHPVFSLNGNVVALVAEESVALSQVFPLVLEVNLFHQSEKRIQLLVNELLRVGASTVLGRQNDMHIPGLDHNRGWCEKEGIYSADVVLVPLEDGDRCQALKDMEKSVITIDLNPFSRTAKTADITIVDNVTRAIPGLIQEIEKRKKQDMVKAVLDGWDNRKNLGEVYRFLAKRLNQME